MSTTLGTWSVDLVAKIEKFESDLGRAAATAERQGEKIRKSLEKSVEGIADRWKEGLFEIGAAIGIGFSVEKVLEFGKRTIEVADQLNKLSQKVGLSVESLSDLNHAAELADVNTESLQVGLVKFSKAANDAATGSKAQVAAFGALGISQATVNAHLNDTDALLKIVADKFAGYKDSATKTAAAVALFGKSGADLIPVLNLGAKGLEEAAVEARKFGKEISTGTAQAAEALNDNIHKLHDVVQGFANQALARVLPQLQAASERFLDWASNSEGLRTTINRLADTLVFLANHLQEIGYAIKVIIEIGLAKVIAGWTAATVTWAGSLVLANEGLVRLKTSVTWLAGGLVAAFSGAQIGTYLYDQFEIVRRSAAIVLGGLMVLWVKVKETALVTWAEIQRGFFEMLDSISNAWVNWQKKSLSSIASGNNSFAENVLGITPAKAQAELDRLNSSLEGVTNRTEGYRVAIALAHNEAAKQIETIRQNTVGFVALGDGTQKAGDGVQRLTTLTVDGRPNLAAFGTGMDEAAKAAAQLQQAELGAAQMLAGLRAQIDPSRKSFDDYVRTIIEINKTGAELKEKGESLAKVQRFLADATAAAAEVQERQRRIELEQLDVTARLSEKLNDQLKLAGLTNEQRAIESDVLDAINVRKAKGLSLSEEEIRQIRETSAVLHAQIDQRNQLRQVIDQFQSTFRTGLEGVSQAFTQLITGGIRNWSDFGKQLVNVARNFIAQIIEQFLQLTVVNRIMNSLFGTNSPTLSFGSLFTGGSGTGLLSLFGAGGGGGAAGGGGGINSGLISALGSNPTSLFSRVFGGGGAFSGASAAGAGSVVGSGGTGAFTGSQAAAAGSTGPGAFATAAPWLGAAAGAFYGWQQGGDTTGKALGAAAYGTAAYTGIGLATGALTAIPVVGWIALAAILVDKFSGGKLFGTKFQTKEATQTINITDAGGTAAVSLYQERQGSLFSGKKRRTKSGTPSDDAVAAAEALFDSVNHTMIDAAKALGTDVIPLISGSFDTISELDKKGHVKSTKTIATVLGQKYEEDANAFAARLSAENIIALIDANQGAGMATKIAQQWRSSAEDLAAGADYLLNVQIGLNRGQTLLAAGANATLESVDAIVEAARAQGETLAQTYQRLFQAGQQYLSMVQQIDAQIASFSAPAMSQFESALAQIYGNAKNLTAQLNATAQAAGLSAARQEDLAKVQQLAGLQAAALVRQLEVQTQQLVAKLYPDTSVDDRIAQLNDEIAAAGTQSIEQIIGGGGVSKKIAERDALVRQKEEHDRFLQRIGDATQLAQNIGDIAFATGRDVMDVVRQLGIDPEKFAKDLGINPGDLGKTLQAAEDQAEALFKLQELSGQTNELLQKILAAIRGDSAVNDGAIETGGGYKKSSGGTLSAAGARYAGIKSTGGSDPVMTEVRDLLRRVVSNTGDTAEAAQEQVGEYRALRFADRRDAAALPRGVRTK